MDGKRNVGMQKKLNGRLSVATCMQSELYVFIQIKTTCGQQNAYLDQKETAPSMSMSFQRNLKFKWYPLKTDELQISKTDYQRF